LLYENEIKRLSDKTRRVITDIVEQMEVDYQNSRITQISKFILDAERKVIRQNTKARISPVKESPSKRQLYHSPDK